MSADTSRVPGWGEEGGYTVQTFSDPCPQCGSHQAYVMPHSTEEGTIDYDDFGAPIYHDIECVNCGKEL